MVKRRTIFECSECGARSPKWLGRCADCGQWNTLVEHSEAPEAPQERSIRARGARGPARALPISAVLDGAGAGRLETGISELDRILGGGLARGGVTLVGGDPGVGKSTLLLQAAGALAAQGIKVLYCSAEESADQVQARARRLGELQDQLFLLVETSLDTILHVAAQEEPQVMIIDSVQTVYLPQLSSTPGTVSQVREVAARVVLHAKSTGQAAMLVGHVTKGGQIAGPRTLEHIVDTVVYFEGDSKPPFRILRVVKNRFGATGELGLFEMGPQGLREVREPSQALLRDRPQGRPGTVVTACVEGSRSLLLEVQALVSPGIPGAARRNAVGVDSARLAMLLAVLGKVGFALQDQEVFVNVAGGVKITETAADLAVAAAVVGSLLERPIEPSWLLLGEIGLTGEVRSLGRIEQRLVEGARHGFERALVPRLPESMERPQGIDAVEVTTVDEALGVLFRM